MAHAPCFLSPKRASPISPVAISHKQRYYAFGSYLLNAFKIFTRLRMEALESTHSIWMHKLLAEPEGIPQSRGVLSNSSFAINSSN
jgi:hypothetical protein